MDGRPIGAVRATPDMLRQSSGLGRKTCPPHQRYGQYRIASASSIWTRSATGRASCSPGSGGPSEHAQILDLFQSQVPDDGSQSGLTVDAAYSADNGSALVVEASSLFTFDDPDVLVEGPEDKLFVRPEIEMGDDGVSFIAHVPVKTING